MTAAHVIFLHLHKAAGSTLYNALRRIYKKNEIYTIDARWPERSLSEFKGLDDREKSKIRLLQGHMHFGLHEYFSEPCTYFTVLRDPIERVVSLYYYIRRRPSHPLYETVTAASMDLETFVKSGLTVHLDNHQVRYLSGCPDSVAFGDCSEHYLEQAIQNIRDHFAFVGLVERFDETILLAKLSLGWQRYPFHKKYNVTKKRSKITNISPSTIDLIRSCNLLDGQLYEWAARKFESRIRAIAHWERDVKMFRAANSVCSKCIIDRDKLTHRTKKLKSRLQRRLKRAMSKPIARLQK